jgi:uncharacterized protein (TIGR00255 family)
MSPVFVFPLAEISIVLLSMTGFGEARRQHEQLTIVAEVRTVNNRYFKLSLRSAEGYGGLESLVEGVVRKHVRRGSVQVQLRIERQRAFDDYKINTDVLESYRRQLAANEGNGALASIRLDALLLLPGVVEERQSDNFDPERDWPAVEATLEAALMALSTMRAAEGEVLASDLRLNCLLVADRLDRIETRLPQVAESYRERLLERINRTLEKFDIRLEANDVVRELSLHLERSDISEEIVRLRSHLEQMEATMQLAESSGRKLDFLTQEMFREANTIGSKSSDVEIPKFTVEIKAAIERLREQVQNVE